VEEHEIVAYFLHFHDTREFPKKTQYPVTLFLVFGHVAQCESLKAFNFRGDVSG
jgi:hypothetical protein